MGNRRNALLTASAVAFAFTLGCSKERLRLNWLIEGAPTIQVVGTFGQLEPGNRVREYADLALDPPATQVRAPSTGTLRFLPSLDQLSDCLILSPKPRSEGADFKDLGAGLEKAQHLRLAFCNMERAGDALKTAVQTLFKAKLDEADAALAAAAFLDPAHAKHADYRSVAVYASPEAPGDAPWSLLGKAAGGRLHLAAFRWNDDGDNEITPNEVIFLNPFPYLQSLVPAGVVSEQPPKIAAAEVEVSQDPGFATTTTVPFDLGTTQPTTTAVLSGFLRFRFKLEPHPPASPNGPTVAPYEIEYTLSMGGAVRNHGLSRLNAFMPNQAAAVAGDLYAAAASDPSNQQFWLHLPIDLANDGGPPTAVNATRPGVPRTVDLSAATLSGPLFPAGDYELEITLRSALGATQTQLLRFTTSGVGFVISLDVNANGSSADPVDGFDTYLPGYEGTDTKIDDTHVQNMKVHVSGLISGDDVEFSLVGTTDWTGINGNVTAPGFSNGPGDPDFVLNPGVGDPGAGDHAADTTAAVTKTAAASGAVWIWLRCRDYAASTTLRIRINGGAAVDRLVPKNSDASATDHLPDAWETPFGNLNDTDDGDQQLGGTAHAETGDGLTAFEEYRGFRVVDPADPARRLYQRTNEMSDHTPGAAASRKGGPKSKDAFVSDTGTKPFWNFGHAVDVYQLSWHIVDPADKDGGPAASGKLNRNTDAPLKVQDQFSVLVDGQSLPGTVLGYAGAGKWNDAGAAVFDLPHILIKMAYFGITPASDPIAIDRAKRAVLAHELGHRLTLRHLVDAFVLDQNDVKPAGSDPETGQLAILVDGANQIQIRLKLQQRSDTGHVGEGYITQVVAYGDVTGHEPTSGSVAFLAPVQHRHIWNLSPAPDYLAGMRALLYEIPTARMTHKSGAGAVQTFDVRFDFKTPATALINAVKAGTKTAKILIWRGHSCLLDAKLVEQDPQFDLTCAATDISSRIQLKSDRPGVAGEHHEL